VNKIFDKYTPLGEFLTKIDDELNALGNNTMIRSTLKDSKFSLSQLGKVEDCIIDFCYSDEYDLMRLLFPKLQFNTSKLLKNIIIKYVYGNNHNGILLLNGTVEM